MTVETRGCDFGCDDSVMPSNYWTGGATIDDIGLSLDPTATLPSSGGVALSEITGTQKGFFSEGSEWRGDASQLWPSDVAVRPMSKYSASNPSQWESVVQFITSPTGAFPSFVYEIFSDPAGDDTNTNIVFVEDYDITCDTDKCTIDYTKKIDKTPCFGTSGGIRTAMSGFATLGVVLVANFLALLR